MKSLRFEPVAVSVMGAGPAVTAVASNGLRSAKAERVARLNATTKADRRVVFFIFGFLTV